MAAKKFRGRSHQGWLPIAPKETPGICQMLDDIGASDDHVALHLGVRIQSVRVWRRQDAGPRAAKLALFYETQWGRQFVAGQVEDDALFFGRAAVHFHAEAERLRVLLAKLGGLGDFGSANDPAPEVAAEFLLRVQGLPASRLRRAA